jgi:hypothetical protein
MEIVIEAAANAAFIIGFFFGPAFALQLWREFKA